MDNISKEIISEFIQTDNTIYKKNNSVSQFITDINKLTTLHKNFRKFLNENNLTIKDVADAIIANDGSFIEISKHLAKRY